MTHDQPSDDPARIAAGDTPASASPDRVLPPAAVRALAEAEERRKVRDGQTGDKRPAELGGRAGPDPVRYGDWEKGGIVSDF